MGRPSKWIALPVVFMCVFSILDLMFMFTSRVVVSGDIMYVSMREGWRPPWVGVKDKLYTLMPHVYHERVTKISHNHRNCNRGHMAMIVDQKHAGPYSQKIDFIPTYLSSTTFIACDNYTYHHPSKHLSTTMEY